jgi:hypothetical protein
MHRKLGGNVGGTVGGSGADRDFLVQRRFLKENNTFPLSTFPQAAEIQYSKKESFPLWEQRVVSSNLTAPTSTFH